MLNKGIYILFLGLGGFQWDFIAGKELFVDKYGFYSTAGSVKEGFGFCYLWENYIELEERVFFEMRKGEIVQIGEDVAELGVSELLWGFEEDLEEVGISGFVNIVINDIEDGLFLGDKVVKVLDE
mmetsp:Transcript_35422/g.31901  ORF Transcript_35422/g.31901 Transcript_35422/m.31901 type:complete len:125 (+) Transcript_35422:762-1136(+)